MASQQSGVDGDEDPPGVQIDLDTSTDFRDLSGEDLFLEFRRLQRENERLKLALIQRESDERKRLKLEERLHRPFPYSVQPDEVINQQELLKAQVREANARARGLETKVGKLKTDLERITEAVFGGSDEWGYGNTDSQGEEGETYPYVDIKRELSEEEDSQYDDQSIETEGNSEEIAGNQEENKESKDNQMDDTQAGSEDSQEEAISTNSQDTRPSVSTSNDNPPQVILPSTSGGQLSSFRMQSTPRASTSVLRSSARLHRNRITSTPSLRKYSKRKRDQLPAIDKTQPHQETVNKGQQEERGSAQDESTDKHNEETVDTPTVNQDNDEGTAASKEETSNQSMTEEPIESSQGTQDSPCTPKTDPDNLYQQLVAPSSSTPYNSTRFSATRRPPTRRTSAAARPTSRLRGNLSSSTPFIPRYAKRKPDKPHAVDKEKLHLGWYCICKNSFKNQGRLSEHIRYFNGDAKFNCEYCPLRFVQLSLLKKHWQTAHKRDFPAGTIGCGDCGGVFTDKEAHKAHRLAMHNKAKIEPRENHAEDEHATELGLFKCICGKPFTKRSYLVNHLRDRTNPHEFRCKECPGSFKTLARLQAHSKRVHKKLAVEKGTYGCGICGELFPVRKMHQQHMQKIHNVISWPLMDDPTSPPKDHGPVALTPNSKGQTPARFFQRCLCGAAFATKKLLTRHIHQKRPKVPFKCSHCSVEYWNHSRLKKHIITIHGKTNYTGVGCTVCGRTFPTAVARRQHYDREHPKEI